ncbi:MAG: O-antigen ligase family protein [Vicinamibacteria bacterium]|nr:O-antigen ligase family protein [Vicinamibacteria bacterium]
MAFTCVLLLAPQNFIPVLGTLRVALLTGAIAIVAHVRDRWALGLPLTRPGREMRLALWILAWALAGIPFSLWPGGSLALLLDLFLKALAVFWLVGNLVDTRPRLRGMALTLTVLTVTLGVVGISNYFSGVFGPTQDVRILGYDAGLARNPNDLALMINLIIPITVALLLSSSGLPMKAALFLALGVQAIAVVLTFSRAGFLTLATTAGLFGLRLLRRPSRGLVLAAAACVLLGLPLIPASYIDRLLTMGAVDADITGSAQARWNGTAAAFEFALAHPLKGAGLGMNILVLNESVGVTWRSVHNVYLEYAVDLGLPGLILFALLLRSCWRGVRVARRTAGPETAQLAEGIEISLLAFSMAALFHPAAYAFYFYFVAGLAVAARVVSEREGAVTA